MATALESPLAAGCKYLDPQQTGPLEVAAVDAAGRQVTGWPYVLPTPGRGQVDMLAAVGGRVYVTVQRCGPSNSTSALLALDADGTLSD